MERDYDTHKTIYAADLQDSKTIWREGEEFDIYLRLHKKQVITVVFAR